ncbi:hypothetical protein EDB86DRAFT_3242988 [Lactarius hatsudake]|nr:hypothetical protein EDB86DRAFT_3242988 [Lactarius hatsudake]
MQVLMDNRDKNQGRKHKRKCMPKAKEDPRGRNPIVFEDRGPDEGRRRGMSVQKAKGVHKGHNLIMFEHVLLRDKAAFRCRSGDAGRVGVWWKTRCVPLSMLPQAVQRHFAETLCPFDYGKLGQAHFLELGWCCDNPRTGLRLVALTLSPFVRNGHPSARPLRKNLLSAPASATVTALDWTLLALRQVDAEDIMREFSQGGRESAGARREAVIPALRGGTAVKHPRVCVVLSIGGSMHDTSTCVYPTTAICFFGNTTNENKNLVSTVKVVAAQQVRGVGNWHTWHTKRSVNELY